MLDKFAYPLNEAAFLSGCTERQVRKMVDDGILDAAPGDGPLRITGASLRRYGGHDHKVRGAHYTLVSDEEYAKAVKHGA